MPITKVTSMSRHFANCKNFSESNLSLQAIAIIIISILILSTTGNYSNQSSNNEVEELGLIKKSEDQSTNYEEGGFHLSTGEWWEPKNQHVPSSTDSDGDGIVNTDDLEPFNRLSGQFSDCLYNCNIGDDPLYSEPTTPSWIDTLDYSSIDAMELVDIDRDYDLDLIIGDVQNNVISISYNVNNEFSDPVTFGYELSPNYAVKSIKTADFDGDGDDDILYGVFCNYNWQECANSVGIFEMDNGSFIDDPESHILLSIENESQGVWRHIEIDDFNGDNYPDILVSASPTNMAGGNELVILFENHGDGTILFEKTWNITAVQNPVAAAADFGDVDGDGDLDIIVGISDDGTSQINIFYQTAGTYPNTPDYSIPTQTPVSELSVVDLTGDLLPEIIFAERNAHTTGILKNLDDFNTPYLQDLSVDDEENYSLFCDVNCGAYEIEVVDINGDNMADIMLASDTWHPDFVAYLYINKGRSGNQIPNYQNFSNWDYDSTAYFHTGDITGNGLMDLIVQPTTNTIEIYRQSGATMDEDHFEPHGNRGIKVTIDGADPTSYTGGAKLATSLTAYGVEYFLEQGSSWDGIGLFRPYDDGVYRIDRFSTPILQVQTSTKVNDFVLKPSLHNPIWKDFIVNDDGLIYQEISDSTHYAPIVNVTNIANPFAELEITTNLGPSGQPETFIITDGYVAPTNVAFNDAGMVDKTLTIWYESITTDGWDPDGDSNPNYNSTFEEVWVSQEGNSTWGNSRKVLLYDLNNDGFDEIIRCFDNLIAVYNSTGNVPNDLSDLQNNWDSEPRIIAMQDSWYGGISKMIFNDINYDNHPDLVYLHNGLPFYMPGPNYSSAYSMNYNYENFELRANDFELFDIDGDNELEYITGKKEGRLSAIYDLKIVLDRVFIGNVAWDGGDRKETISVHIFDENKDNMDDLILLNKVAEGEIIYSKPDGDFDGYMDSEDEFPWDPTQHDDVDSDGYGSSPAGWLGDDCPYYWGDSSEDKRGCPDQDGDGWSDLGDAFWREPTQWEDIDGDGRGDNPAGINADTHIHDFDNDGFNDSEYSSLALGPYDDCKYTAGSSTIGLVGCLDSDLDGYANAVDAFPSINSQHSDSDNDGFGDNIDGTWGDHCPTTPGTSYIDFFGCVDSDSDGYSELTDFDDNDSENWIDTDGDGVGDNSDVFPYDSSEWYDSDDDGVGDNSEDTDGDGIKDVDDAYPFDYDNDGIPSSEDLFDTDPNEWQDSDGDGVGDNSDLWPENGLLWSDSDGDGFTDQLGSDISDDCPSIAGTSEIYQQGCSDIDGDLIPDVLDQDIDGDGITNDNEIDASSDEITYDPFDNTSVPPDLDGDNIPDVLDPDSDGDGFPNSMENERGSDPFDASITPFNLYSDRALGFYYVFGKGFTTSYDPDGIEISLSLLASMIGSEFLLPILLFPISMILIRRKKKRYKKLSKQIKDCEDVDVLLTTVEPLIDKLIIDKKVSIEHGVLLRNLYERQVDELSSENGQGDTSSILDSKNYIPLPKSEV